MFEFEAAMIVISSVRSLKNLKLVTSFLLTPQTKRLLPRDMIHSKQNAVPRERIHTWVGQNQNIPASCSIDTEHGVATSVAGHANYTNKQRHLYYYVVGMSSNGWRHPMLCVYVTDED